MELMAQNTADYIFTSADIDQFIEVDDGFGRLRITQFISGTEVKGITEVPFLMQVQ